MSARLGSMNEPIVYQPADAPGMREGYERAPHLDVLPGLRMHVFSSGVCFGLVDPVDARFSQIVSMEQVYDLFVAAAKRK